MNPIAKIFFSKRKQHDVGWRICRRRSPRHRRKLRGHDVPSEVDAGDLEHTLSTQVVEDVGRDNAASIPPLHEEARPLLIASLLLPPLLALLLTPKSGPVRGFYSTTNPRTLKNCRERSTIRKIVREPEGTYSRAGGA